MLPSRLERRQRRGFSSILIIWGGEDRGGKMIHLTRDLLSLKNLQEPLCGMVSIEHEKEAVGPGFKEANAKTTYIPLCFYLTPFFPGR